MQSTFAWLDFDAAERDRTQRVLALLDEKETRDELGLGAIRDSFADHLFPGTSTIQTRLRYFFFVPWIYLQLEQQRAPSRDIARRARRMELDLADHLMAQPDLAGVFGIVAKGELKRLPSSVYWAGLRKYGICMYPGGLYDYHRDLDSISARRQRKKHETDGTREIHQFTWHPKLPPAPPGFPERIDFRLTPEEAHFFRERLRAECPDSLLTFLAWNPAKADVDFPWEHPSLASFSHRHREMLEHARLFSLVMSGAGVVYNLMLAEVAGRDDWSREHRKLFVEWSKDFRNEQSNVAQWQLDRFWSLAHHRHHTISYPTREFVKSWISFVLAKENLVDDPAVRNLVRSREMRLKGRRSRFQNRRALEKWGGAAGLYRLSYRWRSVRRLLADLAET